MPVLKLLWFLPNCKSRLLEVVRLEFVANKTPNPVHVITGVELLVPQKRVGDVCKTIAPVPVGAVAVVIAKVPDEVMGPPETASIDGTAKLTDVTVP